MTPEVILKIFILQPEGNAVNDFTLKNQGRFSGWPGLSYAEIGANRVFKAPVVGGMPTGALLNGLAPRAG